jgi:Ca2+-binding EF-hand superfamily protein
MSKARKLFEKELKNKLSLKSDGRSSEEKLIIQAFKYFDLDNSGECSRDEFGKAMAKLGVNGFSETQFNDIFKSYDANNNCSLDYKEFSAILYGEDDDDEQPKSNSKTSNGDNQKLANSKIMDKFRERILARGGKSIIGLARQFKIFDDDNSRTLCLSELQKAIKDFRVDLSPSEVKILFNMCDVDGSGEVNYDEFLREIRGDMNNVRTKLVDQAFSKLDTDGSGVVDFHEIEVLYNAKKHPDVISGKRTERDILLEFMSTFQQHAQSKGKGSVDDSITREEFQEYYENISASIDRDDYFVLMMTNCWKLGERPKYETDKAKAWSNSKQDNKKGNRNFQSTKAPYGTDGSEKKKEYGDISDDLSPIEKFREVLIRRGTRGIMSIRRSFMIADDNGDKTIDNQEFKKLCGDYRIPINDKDIKILFKQFDIDGSGTISYDEFLRGIVGEMNKKRRMIVKRCFDILDKNRNGAIELDDIRGTYNASKHPDVIKGKKTEDEVLGEFLDTFEYHFNLLNDNKSRDRSISLDEFNEYYNNISMSIDRDDYFELMMNNAWNLDGKKVTKKGTRQEV